MTLLQDFLRRHALIAQHEKGEEATTSSSLSTSSRDDDQGDDEPVPVEKRVAGVHDEDSSNRHPCRRHLSSIHSIIVEDISLWVQKVKEYSILAMTHIVTIGFLLVVAYLLFRILGSVLYTIEQDSMSGFLFTGVLVYFVGSVLGQDDD